MYRLFNLCLYGNYLNFSILRVILKSTLGTKFLIVYLTCLIYYGWNILRDEKFDDSSFLYIIIR